MPERSIRINSSTVLLSTAPVLTKDETRILSWSDDHTLRLWDVATGQQIGPAMKHDGAVVGAVLTEGRDAHPVLVRRPHPAPVGHRDRPADRTGHAA